ncbi:hypothetical protein [Hymenobacter baengnokdamensis]|uniref:hypothetical protein n=1 Tax=Hymenobacter baengnokdamensis TaxID=2615203 RepID=UPI00124879EA|nr:hypothetical protein [Hymenobacter baengnokdamensis]
MTTSPATAIKLPFWQDPQSSLALVVTPTDCDVFFTLLSEGKAEPSDELGKISFLNCWATHMVKTEFLPYSIAEHSFHSFLLEVIDSAWLATATRQRSYTYPAWKNWDGKVYHHYIVQGHNSYVEVLAVSFTTSIASPEEGQRYAFSKG